MRGGVGGHFMPSGVPEDIAKWEIYIKFWHFQVAVHLYLAHGHDANQNTCATSYPSSSRKFSSATRNQLTRILALLLMDKATMSLIWRITSDRPEFKFQHASKSELAQKGGILKTFTFHLLGSVYDFSVIIIHIQGKVLVQRSRNCGPPLAQQQSSWDSLADQPMGNLVQPGSPFPGTLNFIQPILVEPPLAVQPSTVQPPPAQPSHAVQTLDVEPRFEYSNLLVHMGRRLGEYIWFHRVNKKVGQYPTIRQLILVWRFPFSFSFRFYLLEAEKVKYFMAISHLLWQRSATKFASGTANRAFTTSARHRSTSRSEFQPRYALINRPEMMRCSFLLVVGNSSLVVHPSTDQKFHPASLDQPPNISASHLRSADQTCCSPLDRVDGKSSCNQYPANLLPQPFDDVPETVSPRQSSGSSISSPGEVFSEEKVDIVHRVSFICYYVIMLYLIYIMVTKIGRNSRHFF
jgi:hypothetical protein